MATLRVPVSSLDHIEGSEDALVTLVEYGDFQCPHCRAAHPVVEKLQRHFGEKLRFAFRHFPLTEIHPYAAAAAESAEFAGAHQRFWEMHDGIYENQDRLDFQLLFILAGNLSLSAPSLEQALAKGQYKPKVEQDFLGGVRSGVNGTPGFFINGRRHDGGYDYSDMAEAIDDAMAGVAPLS
jgi:protein-disulfide isomerase